MRLLFLAFILLTSLFADEYVIIANKHMDDLTATQIKAIFLKKLLVVHDTNVVPVNLDARDPLRIKFDHDVLEMNFDRLQAYWTKEHYLGHRPPISLKSQESIKAFVKKVDGSIGYINIENVDDNLKILYKWSD